MDTYQLAKSAYQAVTSVNYGLEVVSRGHSVGESEFKSYEVLNTVESDSMVHPLLEHLSEGDLVFDIGANVGNYSLAVCGMGETTSAVAVEADPQMASMMSSNTELNSFKDRVSPVCAAASDTHGESITFYRSQDRASGSVVEDHATAYGDRGEVEIPTVTLDHLATKYGMPDILKLDVEGHIIPVLDGATDVLKSRPTVFFETHEMRDHGAIDKGSSEVIELLTELDYSITEGRDHYEAYPN